MEPEKSLLGHIRSPRELVDAAAALRATIDLVFNREFTANGHS
jgi:hypothetical protein